MLLLLHVLQHKRLQAVPVLASTHQELVHQRQTALAAIGAHYLVLNR